MRMKRLFILLLITCLSSTLFGQHFKVQHATSRRWVSQSNTNQRGAEYRLIIQAQKKFKNLTISRVWISDKCYAIESLIVDDKSISSSNQKIAKGTSIKIYINAKEVLNSSGVWILNNDDCKGTIPQNLQKNSIIIEYNANGTPCTMTIKDVEILAPIQFN
jgi:hypothetical protein